MGIKFSRAILALFVAGFLNFAWAPLSAHAAGSDPIIVGFNGSKIKLYTGKTGKDVWKKVPSKKLKGGYKILDHTNSRYAFKFEGRTVWVKRKNTRTNNVTTGLPPCPKVANIAQEAAGNAVSRGSGKGCK